MAKAAATAEKTKTTKAKSTKATAAQKEQARKARAGARAAKATKEKKTVKDAVKDTVKDVFNKKNTSASPSAVATRNASDLAGIGGVNFAAADYITGDIWVPNPAIPAIDEATYEAQLTQAQGQSRSIEVAAQNLKNINGLHKLEGQSVEIAITAKANETRYAKLEGGEIALQTQLQANGEATEKLTQATAKHQAAQRETGYTTDLIGLKDQNFQLEIQQAQTVFAEKAARYRAQLAG